LTRGNAEAIPPLRVLVSGGGMGGKASVVV
jgi:hypothetical protein